MFGFLGPNGAGKTTTMRMILDLIRPDSGQITWNGVPVSEVARRSFGYLPEERGLYPRMEVEAQLLFLARLSGLSKPDAQAALEEWLERLPNQALRFTYDTHASSTSDPNLPTIQALVQQLNVLDVAHRLGLTSSQLSSLFAPPDVAVVHTQGTGSTSESTEEILLGLAGAIVLYVSVVAYGNIVAAGVAEEKSGRRRCKVRPCFLRCSS